MKKIISLFLLLACVFAFAACAPAADTTPKDIFALMKSSATPTRVVTDITYNEKDGGNAYSGHYVTEGKGQDAVMTYEYSRPARLEEAAESEFVTVKGTLKYKDGKVGEGDTYVTEAIVLSGDVFNFDRELLADVSVSEDGRTLSATIAKENIAKVLGTDLKTEGNVTLTVKSNGTHITNINIAYTTPSGAAVAVRTSRSYNAIDLDFGGNA